MNGKTLSTTSLEKDLGILISSSLKPSAQVAKAAAFANCMLGCIKHTFTDLDLVKWIPAFKCYQHSFKQGTGTPTDGICHPGMVPISKKRHFQTGKKCRGEP